MFRFILTCAPGVRRRLGTVHSSSGPFPLQRRRLPSNVGVAHDSRMEVAPITDQSFWTNFVQRVPEFADRYQRELDSDGGELVAHFMFGHELVPYVEDLLRTPTEAISSPPSSAKRKRKRARGLDYDQQLASDDILRRL